MNTIFNRLLQVTGLTTSLLFLAQSAQAAGLAVGGKFSLFLECNNDGIAQILGTTNTVNNWQYTSDAKNDNTDGFLYDILGMATKQTKDELVVVISGNTPLAGTGFDRDGNTVKYGSLFFTPSNEGTFDEAMESGNLYAINFAGSNESGVKGLGVYSNVTAKGIGINNFGHRTIDNYMGLVDENVSNFLGDVQTKDLDKSFLNRNSGLNVIGKGTKVQNDGFELLSLTHSLLTDFNQTNFKNAGTELIAFKVKLDALQKQPTLQEQAELYNVTWNTDWDTQLAGFDTQINQVQDQINSLNKNQINPLNKELSDMRKAYPGFNETNDRRNATNDREKLVKDVSKAQGIINTLEAKLANWNAMSPEEQENAAPEAVWTRKDQLDIEYQKEELAKDTEAIAAIDAKYTSAELATAKTDYNNIMKDIRNNVEGYKDKENQYNALVNDRKELEAERNGYRNEKTALEQSIRDLIAAQRKQEVAQAAEAEKAQEVATGGPRTSPSIIPGTAEELQEALNPSTPSPSASPSASPTPSPSASPSVDPQEVPEPITMTGLALGLAGAIAARRRQSNKA